MSRRIVVGCLLIGLAAAGAVLFVVVRAARDDGRAQTLTAQAEVDAECQFLEIRVDGMLFTTDNGVPTEWKGETVQGSLAIEEQNNGEDRAGTFTGDDGAAVAVRGGAEDEYFYNPSCIPWT